MATTKDDDEVQRYLKLRGWAEHAGVPGVWTCPQGTGDYTLAEAEQIQRQRDEREGRSS
ncbi:MAG TPA: hypothetical protein VKD72_28920 [Gemmataceae bacterium]|nr:hypothetical protein [Gemmataceae bacterium]